MHSLSALVTLAATAVTSARTITITNNCAATLWAALYTDMSDAGSITPNHTTGCAFPVPRTVRPVTTAAQVGSAAGCLHGRRSPRHMARKHLGAHGLRLG
jgi:hypothetical protein